MDYPLFDDGTIKLINEAIKFINAIMEKCDAIPDCRQLQILINTWISFSNKISLHIYRVLSELKEKWHQLDYEFSHFVDSYSIAQWLPEHLHRLVVAKVKKSLKSEMQRKSSLLWSFSIFLIVLSVNASIPQANLLVNKSILTSSMMPDIDTYHGALIDYIEYIFCFSGSYRAYYFFHIYIERSVSTALPDKLINRLNECLAGGILTSR